MSFKSPKCKGTLSISCAQLLPQFQQQDTASSTQPIKQHRDHEPPFASPWQAAPEKPASHSHPTAPSSGMHLPFPPQRLRAQLCTLSRKASPIGPMPLSTVERALAHRHQGYTAWSKHCPNVLLSSTFDGKC